MKVCKGCGLEKPLSDFWKDKQRPDGLQRGCKICDMKRGYAYAKTPKGRYSFLKRKGTNLTREEFYTFISQLCHYCGGPLNRSGSGLDQIIPSKGYIRDNVVPCCLMCNVVKRNWFTYDEMIMLGSALRAILNLRESTPADGSATEKLDGICGISNSDLSNVVGTDIHSESDS